MAQNRTVIIVNSTRLTPDLGEMVIGQNCARTNGLELIQTVRFRTSIL